MLFLCQLAAQVVEQCTLIEGTYTSEQVKETGDGVYNYARVHHFGTLKMDLEMHGLKVMVIVYFNDGDYLCPISLHVATQSTLLKPYICSFR